MSNRTPSHDANGNFQASFEDKEEEAEAARLKSRGFSYAMIAKEQGCSKSTAFDRVRRALAAVPVEAVTELRKISTDQFEDQRRMLMAIALAKHPMVSHGKVIPGVFDLGPTIAALRELRLLAADWRKMTGQDAPTQHRVTIDDQTANSIERLARELDELAAGAPVPADGAS